MRTKRDPNIRREAFITAATQLFIERGFEGVSVRDVLDSVGEKSSSPSVLYYYFKSKEELYHCVLESIAHNYVAGFDAAFAQTTGTLEKRATQLLDNVAAGFSSTGKLITATDTLPNHLFMLDMRERVTEALAEKWSAFLVEEGLASPDEAAPLSLYITGGIGQLLFSQLEGDEPTEQQTQEIVEHIAHYTMAVLGISLNLPLTHTEQTHE